jgi:dolichol-phosphate mannosyltransferase
MPRSTFYVVAPVFNEAGNVPSLLGAFRDLSERLTADFDIAVIVVDDGSSDGTAAALCRVGGDLTLTVLSHSSNRGPGAAFATAFSYLADRVREDDWVVTIEGDNTSRHELIPQMLKRTGEGYDVVLASPYLYGGDIINTSFFRRFLSYGANILMKEILEIRGILTLSSFFRLYRGSIIRQLQKHYGRGIVERAGFDCMVELLMKMVFLRVTLSEVPMVLDSSRRRGTSKMKVWRATYDLVTLVGRKNRWKRAAQTSPVSNAPVPAQATFDSAIEVVRQ